jgi:hypothetical protein
MWEITRRTPPHLALGNEQLAVPLGVPVERDLPAIKRRALIGRDRDGQIAAVQVEALST